MTAEDTTMGQTTKTKLVSQTTPEFHNQPFTPGAWTPLKGFEDEGDRWCVTTEPSGCVVAMIHNGGPGDCLETEAGNARLIAAAPEMFAALQAALPVLAAACGDFQIPVHHLDRDKAASMVLAALKRARGEQP